MSIEDLNPHLALWRSETRAPRTEQLWLNFCASLAAHLCVADLDGDQRTDGYSLDVAQELFQQGCTAAEAADRIGSIGRE